MKNETLLGAKLAAKGITARKVALDIALAQFVNHGGTFAEGLAGLCGAFGIDGEHSAVKALLATAAQQFERDETGRFKAFSEKGSEGPGAPANRHADPADASRTYDGEKGLRHDAVKAQGAVPASPSTQNGAGRQIIAKQAVVPAPRSVPKMPGHAKRGVGSASLVQEVMAKSLFDITKLPDGRTLREIRWSECPNLAARYRRFSRIFMAIHNIAVPADPDTTLDNMVSEDGLKDIIATVERFNDIH